MINVDKVKDVGPKSLMLFNKLGIKTVEDLLYHYPYRYNIIKKTDLEKAEDQDKVIIDGKVDSAPILIRLKGNLNKMNFRLITSDNKVVGISIFNRAFLKKMLTVGSNITVIGKYEKTKNIIMASEIRPDLLSKEGKIESVYHGTNGLTSKNISTFINNALMGYGNKINDNIPKYLIEEHDFLNKKTSLNLVHNPSDKERLEKALNRLKYEELFVFMTKINYLKEQSKNIKNGIEKNYEDKKINDLIKQLPFELTNDQNEVLKEILDDIKSPRKMNRLLQGDVGSGKTIVSLIAMYANYLSGYQGAMMVPTEILATQHYKNIKELFKNKNIKIELLVGSLTKKEKTTIHEKLENGEIDIVVGTHALIQEEVKYKNLGFVLTDEQHRFGVVQRMILKDKGKNCDVLYMSATPIPRTYALTIYGDMDISTIKTMPKGRKEIDTYLKTTKEIPEVLEKMHEQLKAKHQVYVIAPLIEESEILDLTTINELKEKMDIAFKKEYKVEVVHGKIPQKTKDRIMNDFNKNKIQILISTTVIEVGIDVPNTTMIVIFDANRFGLSTLHQLRGRVGRSDLKSTCILISDSDTKRLDVMTKTNDGFKISEEDFKLRGHGDLFGVKQSGDINFKIANIKKDYKILLQAKKDSLEFLNKKEIENEFLKQKILQDIKQA